MYSLYKLCVHIFLNYVCLPQFTLLSLTLIQYPRVYSIFPPHTYLTFITDTEKPGSHYLQFIFLFVQPTVVHVQSSLRVKQLENYTRFSWGADRVGENCLL